MPNLAFQEPPSNIPAENALLGGLIITNEAIPQVVQIGVTEGSFHSPQNGQLFRNIVGLHTLGKPVDAVTLLSLNVKGIEASYLGELIESVPNTSVFGILSYAEAVAECCRERRVYQAAASYLRGTSQERSNGVLAQLRLAVDEQKALIEKRGPRVFEDILEEARNRAKVERVKLEIPKLDDAIGGGVLPGWFVVVGGFAGGAKSTTAAFFASRFSSGGHPVMVVTTELSEDEFSGRIETALGSKLPERRLRIWSPEGDIYNVISTLTAWRKELPEGLFPVVIIDYLQRVRAPVGESNRERQVAVVAETLQTFGRKHGVLIIGAAQLNRQSQNEGTPQLHHLRESGLIEQVADIALLVSKTGDNQLRLGVAKNRWGTSGANVDVYCDYKAIKFLELSPQDVYGKLSTELEAKLIEAKKSSIEELKIRDVVNLIRFGNGHPKKPDIQKAADLPGSKFEVWKASIRLKKETVREA